MRVVVAPLRSFPSGERRIVEVAGRSIGVFRVGENFYGIRDRCPHQGGPLCLGHLLGGTVAPGVRSYGVAFGAGRLAGEAVRAAAAPAKRVPGPYVAETFEVDVEDEYVVLHA